MPKRTLIRDLKAHQMVEGIFAVQNCQLGLTRGGKPYLKCLLADRSARVPARMWSASEELFNSLPTDGFVHVVGQTQPYQGEMQIIIQEIAAAQPSQEDLLELLPATENDIDEMFQQVSQLLDTLQHPAMQALARAYLDDAELMTRFKRAPAAMSLHHAFLGGLLEHTLGVLRLANATLPFYPQLNRDIVLVGLFIHDLGKCLELTWDTGFGYSDDGQLVGHIARGVIILDRKAQQLAEADCPVPEPMLRVLHHIVLSHHGRPEYGALKVPATPEAVAVSLLDNVDAKLQMVLASAARDQPAKDQQLGGHFTEKIWALETRIYRPDPATVEAPSESPSTPPAPSGAQRPRKTENRSPLRGGL